MCLHPRSHFFPIVPQCVLAAKDDPAWPELQKFITTESKHASQNVFKRVEAPHGFLGSRGPQLVAADYAANPELAKVAQQSIHDLITFFSKTL